MAMLAGMLPMLLMLTQPVYAAPATQIKIWNGTEMQTYTLGTDILPDGLFWNSAENRLELDGYNGGRIEGATSGDELTFYVLNDSTIDGGEGNALKYSNPTINGAAGITLTLTGTKSSVMYITGSCTIKNITVKVNQIGTVRPNGHTTGTSGNIDVCEDGRLEITLNKETSNPYPAVGCSGILKLYDNGSASISVTANDSATAAYGVSYLSLYGTGDCIIQVTNNGTGVTRAAENEPTVNTAYNVTGAWDSPSVSYTAADPNVDTGLQNIKVYIAKPSYTWESPALTPAYDKATRNYTLNVDTEYNTIYFYLQEMVSGQAVAATVDGAALAVNTAVNGFQTVNHSLTNASTVFVFTVTSKDGSATDTYTVTVNRTDATVDSIAVNSTSHKIAYKVGDALDVTDLTIEATMSDSSTQTINVTAEMVTGFDSSAVAASKTLTITYESKTTTYDISIAKADGPAVPTGLAGVKPTTPGGSDGKITGTTALMEYASDTAFTSPTDCTDTETTGLSAGTYYIRVKETATHEAGAYATVTVPAGTAATVDSIAVNSTTHKTAYKVGEALDVTNLTIEATMSDSSTQTINVTPGMVTGFDSSAVAASKTLTITYESKTTTYDISIAKADGPAAPTGLAGVKPTTPGGSDGKITGTTALMEYDDNSSFTSPTDCTDTETTGLSAGTYYVRVKETATHEAGAYAMITVPAGTAATVYSIAVNSTTHKTAYKVGEALDVTNLTIEATMSDSSTQTINVTAEMVTGFDSSAVAASKTLTITYESKTTTYDISIAKADGPAAPTGLAGVKPTTPGGTDGKITGTTALMEYASDTAFTSPTDCTDTETTGLSAGTYYIRVKETATHEAGTYATVTVPAGDVATYTVTISGGGTGATGSGSYSAGTTVNIYAGDRSGYTFTGWTSSDVTITNASNKNASFTMPDHDVTVEAVFAEIPAYTITKGANGSWEKGIASGFEVTCNGDYSKFTGIKVDGVDVDATNYTAVSGSTVVTLKPSFIETLTLGKHTLELIYTDGSVHTEFTILAADDPAELPKTGGATTYIWLFGLILSLSGCAALLFLRKLKMERAKQ